MKTAVIGAGIAGTRIARLLSEAGAEVEIFEKARGPAGRTSTRRTEAGHFDHGAQYFTARSPVFQAQVKDWLERGLAAHWDACVCEIEDGIAQTERERPLRYVGRPRMSVLARDLAEGVVLRSSVRVEHVQAEARGWTLHDDRAKPLGRFDAVVVATPAPQAIPLLAASSSLSESARQAGMLPCHAVMVRFEEPVLAPFDAAFVRSSPLAWVARNDSKPGRGDETCWVLHSDADWSRENLEGDLEEIGSTLIQAFADALTLPLPAVRYSSVHRWLYARPLPLDGSGPRWDGERRMGICGDWVRGARVEDAYLSAEELFARMRDGLRGC